MSTYAAYILNTRRKKKNGTYPLLIRIFHKGNNTTLSTGYEFLENEWNQEKCVVTPKYSKAGNIRIINQTLSDRLNEINKKIIDLDNKNALAHLSPSELRKSLTEAPTTSIIEYLGDHIESLKSSKQGGNARHFQSALNAIRNYHRKDLTFFDVDVRFLNKYQAHLKSKGVKQNSISAYLRPIRTIFNKAIDENIIGVEYYPFRRFKIKSEKTQTRNLSITQLRKIKEAEYSDRLALYTDIFMFSFYLAGMNFVDIYYLKRDQVTRGRINYLRQKTRHAFNFKLPDPAIEIINRHKSKTPYVFPLNQHNLEVGTLEATKKENQAIKICNGYLQQIGGFTTYYARHSWANIAKQMGISEEIRRECLGHAPINKVTHIYSDDFDQKIIDETLLKVSELVFKT